MDKIFDWIKSDVNYKLGTFFSIVMIVFSTTIKLPIDNYLVLFLFLSFFSLFIGLWFNTAEIEQMKEFKDSKGKPHLIKEVRREPSPRKTYAYLMCLCLWLMFFILFLIRSFLIINTI